MVADIVLAQAKKYVNDNKDEFEEDEYYLTIDTLLNTDYIKQELISNADINDKVIHITFDDNKYEVVDKGDGCCLQ